MFIEVCSNGSNQDGDTTESGDIITTQDEELQSNIMKRKKKLQKLHAKAANIVEKETVEEDEDEDDELQSDEEEPGETDELQPLSLQEYFK